MFERENKFLLGLCRVNQSFFAAQKNRGRNHTKIIVICPQRNSEINNANPNKITLFWLIFFF